MKEIGNIEEFNEIITSTPDKLVVIDFWATWCGQCRFLSPIIDEIEAENNDIIVAKVNIEKPENLNIAKECNVSTLPTLLFYKNGELRETSVGLKTKQTIVQIMERNK